MIKEAQPTRRECPDCGQLIVSDKGFSHHKLPLCDGWKRRTLPPKMEEMYEDLGDTMTFMGFDDALIGFSQRMNEPILAVYDYIKMIDILMDRDQMDFEEADEFLQFNTVSAWFGERTPIIVFPVEYYGI